MARRPIASVLTLGCKLNLADSEAIARQLQSAGFDVVDRLCDADAFVVNTCSVTHVADKKSRRLIRSARRMSESAPVTVTGCYPAGASEALDVLGADLVVGMNDAGRAELVAFITERARRTDRDTRDAEPTGGFADATLGDDTIERLGGAGLHTRAFVKAQEGCNDVCSFCIVPRLRGQERSLPAARVVAEIDAAVRAGAREVVVTGTQLGAWGRDFATPQRPHDLIGAILEGSDAARIRFSSLQPQDITPELLALWQDPRLMPHFHLALQSGSDAVLRRMRRRYTAGQFAEAAARIYAAVPGAAITTDVIAGFPGETEVELEETLALCEEVGFARLHCFPYSARARTAGARLPDQTPPEVRKERMARLLALGERLSLRFRATSEGAVRAVLWESEQEVDGGRWWRGHSDTYVVVYGRGKELANRIAPVRLGPVYHDGVQATLVNDQGDA